MIVEEKCITFWVSLFFIFLIDMKIIALKLGFWALVKSSGLPSSLKRTEQLFMRSIHKYDEDYTEMFEVFLFFFFFFLFFENKKTKNFRI